MYNKVLNVWSLGKLVSFVFDPLSPDVSLDFVSGNISDSRENKTNCFPCIQFVQRFSNNMK